MRVMIELDGKPLREFAGKGGNPQNDKKEEPTIVHDGMFEHIYEQSKESALSKKCHSLLNLV